MISLILTVDVVEAFFHNAIGVFRRNHKYASKFDAPAENRFETPFKRKVVALFATAMIACRARYQRQVACPEMCELRQT